MFTDIRIMQSVFDKHQIEQFIEDGYVCIDDAFDRQLAEQARAILWKDTGCDPDDPATWNEPVIRLGMYNQEPFITAANTPKLLRAFNELVGPDRWIPCKSMGSFPIRFPSNTDPIDTGWHVDASFPGTNPENYFQWRVNIESKGRALLMLFLFSDVADNDAPTRLKVGSHIDVARILAPFGNEGMSFSALAEKLSDLPDRKEAIATGPAGTVYLCHPFLAHAAQPHRGKTPKFMAQPPLILKEPLNINRDAGDLTVLEESIRRALR